MAKLNYDRDVKPLVKRLQPQFKAIRGGELGVRCGTEKWLVTQTGAAGMDVICEGTLRECYCFLNGMAEFLI